MPRGGPAAFVTFADTVIAKQLAPGCEGFEEVIRLKDDGRNRFIGSGCDSVDVGGDNSIAALSLISASSGSLLVETNINEIRKRCTTYTSASDRQRADTERLKGKLEQALYYSESPVNPLTFQLPAVLQGTLMTAAANLSRELLTFSNPIAATVPASVDLRVALKDRSAKLKFLIKFIARCGHLEKLPQTTKRQLRSDAELAAALGELWVYQNEFYSSSTYSSSQGQSPLARAIEVVMAEQGLGGGEDVVRRFFRHHADLTTTVLGRLLKQSKEVVTQALGKRSRDVLELNRVVVGAVRAALRYRRECGGLYGVLEEKDSGAAYQGWTAESTTVQLLESLFSVTVNLIPDRTRELGSSIDSTTTTTTNSGNEEPRIQLELKSQLCSLAEIALACYEERLHYLSSAAAGAAAAGGAGDSALERELSVFGTTYRSARPLFIRPLVTIGRSDKAFTLAEQYQDFRTLVELSTDPSLRSDARIDTFLERYRESFAYELYSYYLEQNQPQVLLTQKPEYSNLVLSYLEQTHNLRLGCISSLPLELPASGTPAADELASEIVDTIATRLVEYPAYRQHYIALVQKLLFEGKYLASEDLVDLLTLKDAPSTQLEDFATAIKVLVRAKDAPQQRLDSALKAVWRRAVIRDDWIALSETGGVSDQMVMQDLKATALYAVLKEVLGEEANRSAYIDLQSLIEEEDGEDGEGAAAAADGEQKGGVERKLLQARFDDAPDHFISLLMEDLEKEKATVVEFMDDSDLPRLVGELAGVAAQEAEEAQGEATMIRQGGEEAEDSMLIE
ncbi:hypothetical protein NDA16_002064 [Ustilago loliicola]|nr:hypothetical protein NDA16_002064 [Ustilago loliicola]